VVANKLHRAIPRLFTALDRDAGRRLSSRFASTAPDVAGVAIGRASKPSDTRIDSAIRRSGGCERNGRENKEQD